MRSSSSPYLIGAAGREQAFGVEEGKLPEVVERTIESLEDYARREPWTFAAWVFGVGFVLGWKLKIW